MLNVVPPRLGIGQRRLPSLSGCSTLLHPKGDHILGHLDLSRSKVRQDAARLDASVTFSHRSRHRRRLVLRSGSDRAVPIRWVRERAQGVAPYRGMGRRAGAALRLVLDRDGAQIA